MKAAPTRKQM